MAAVFLLSALFPGHTNPWFCNPAVSVWSDTFPAEEPAIVSPTGRRGRLTSNTLYLEPIWKGTYLQSQETIRSTRPKPGEPAAGSEPGTHRAGTESHGRAARPGSRRSFGEKRQKSVLTLRPAPGPRNFSWVFRMFAFLLGLGPHGFTAEPQRTTGRSRSATQAAPRPPPGWLVTGRPPKAG